MASCSLLALSTVTPKLTFVKNLLSSPRYDSSWVISSYRVTCGPVGIEDEVKVRGMTGGDRDGEEEADKEGGEAEADEAKEL